MKYNPLELLYRFAFAVVLFYRKFTGGYDPPFLVVSIGNLSVGGTGKSLLASFLIRKIQGHSGAIITRGYGRKICDGKTNQIISFGDGLLVGAEYAGDEASMLSDRLSVPIIVGANRARSARLLERDSEVVGTIDYVVLDDAYQNFALKKDFEILLFDARTQLGGARCLPFGRLREKDFSRADVIFLTHSDEVERDVLRSLIKEFSLKFDLNKIFCGKHIVKKISLRFGGQENGAAQEECFLAVAGIGSFSGFLHSLSQANLSIIRSLEYRDHYKYAQKDMVVILEAAREIGVKKIVTTEKDWQKFKPLLNENDTRGISFYVLDIDFEFLSEEEECVFWKLLYNSLSWEIV